MPIYTYDCKSCGHQQDVVKSVKDFERPEPCEKCGGETVRDVPRKTTVQFKGSGFYETDYKRQGK